MEEEKRGTDIGGGDPRCRVGDGDGDGAISHQLQPHAGLGGGLTRRVADLCVVRVAVTLAAGGGGHICHVSGWHIRVTDSGPFGV